MATTAYAGRPAPKGAQMRRIRDGIEVYGIVHWGLNTYTDREWGFGDVRCEGLTPMVGFEWWGCLVKIAEDWACGCAVVGWIFERSCELAG